MDQHNRQSRAMRGPWSNRISYWKEATASEKHTCIPAGPAGEGAPFPLCFTQPQRDLPVRKAEGTSNTTIQTLGGQGRGQGIQVSLHLPTQQLPCLKVGAPPICSCPLRTICYNKNHVNNNSSRTPRSFHGSCVLSGVLKDQSVGSAELLLTATAKLGQQQNLRPFSTRVTRRNNKTSFLSKFLQGG